MGSLNPIYDVNDKLCNMAGALLKGITKDNIDPLHLSRIRVDLGERTKGLPEDKLPWAFPLFGIRGQEFPKINEKVLVICIDENMSTLLYVKWPGNIEFQNQDLHGFVDYYGSLHSYNTATGEYIFHHKSGAIISIDANNTIKLTGVNVELSATQSMKFKANQMSFHCQTWEVQAGANMKEVTVSRNNVAAMISNSTSPAPTPESPSDVPVREVPNEETN